MNMNPELQAELKTLIDAICDETISPSESNRLEAILTTDEAAMQFYIESMWMHDGITRLSSGYQTRIDAAKFSHNTIEDPKDNEMVTTAAPQSVWKSTATGNANHYKWMISSGIAAILLAMVAIAVYWVATSGQSTPIVESPNGSINGGHELAVDSKHSNQEIKEVPFVPSIVDSSDLHREELSDGTIVIARAGTKFNIVQPRQISLEKGELFLIVAKSDQPFIVKTSDGEVHATGTRFTVSTGSVETQSATLAAVAQGNVVLKSDAGNIELGVGQKGTLTKTEPPTRGPARRFSYLVNWAKDALTQDELLVEPAGKENGLIAIDPYGQEARLTLRKYNVDVYIEDGIARTTIDQTFFNHNPWNTEGTFYFPLPPDASVSRLAMYVAGQLNEGGMVSRQRGQEIYTEILYQRRDPALLEMMEGNMFKMRIFPLEGRQEKRIFLSYTQNLDELYGTTKYWFPMDHTQDLAGEVSIKVRVKDGAKEFEPGSSTHEMKITTDGDDLVMEYRAEKIKPNQDFLLGLLPKNDKQSDDVRVAICEHEGQNYLTAKLRPDLSGNHDPEPRQWIVINDVSASRSAIDIQAQRYVLKRLITEADDDDSVFLMDLNTTARNVSVKPVNVRSNEVKPLLNHRPQRSIGATNIAAGLDAVRQIIREHGLENPHVVYLGDGVATDGEKAQNELSRLIPNNCKFVGIGVGKKVDAMFLQQAANQTGGLFTTINPNEDIDWRVFDLIASMNTNRMSNIRVTLLDENDKPMETIAYPSSSVIAAGETLTVTALCDKKLPTKIEFTGNVNKRPVTKTATIDNAKQGAKYLPRLWAKLHIDELLSSGMSNEEEIIALSKSFYVVTPFTSLIVLEDDAMYAEYDVERGRKDHWAMYDAPKKIDVVKEPVDWNRWGWGWGNFQGEDAKIDATTQPKTIQEIVDNVQFRINAPFYLWQNEPQDSRSGLYQMCDYDLGESDLVTRLMTLRFLMAAGQRDSAVEFGQGVFGGPSNTEGQQSKEKTDEFRSELMQLRDTLGPVNSQLFGNLPGQTEMFRFRGATRSSRFALMGEELPLDILDIGMDGEDIRRMVGQQVASQFTNFYDFDLEPKLFGPFQQAVSNRRSRIQRDVEKYNSQFGRNHWGQWNTWESIDLNGRMNWNGGAGLDDLLNEIGVDNDADGLKSEKYFQPFGLEPALNFLQSFDEEFLDREEDVKWFVTNTYEIGDLVAPRGQSLSLVPMELNVQLNNKARSLTQRFGTSAQGSSIWMDTGLPGLVSQQLQAQLMPLAAREMEGMRMGGPAGFGRRMRQQAYFATSQQPIRKQPGMAAVLSADLLAKRLAKLKVETVLDEKQLAEKKAIEVALSNMDRVGAQMESSGEFWGYAGWSYQPRPESIQPPTIQAYSGYRWSFDLTRYADGLYSNSSDLMHEVVKQYGESKPLGSIDDRARKLIQDSRSSFQPVSIQLDEKEGKILVGPNDQFAYTHRNNMYLTESLTSDGTQIVQAYDELGLAARREVSSGRLSDLRRSVPHMIEPADSMVKLFDVDLVESNDDSFKLKLTVAKQSKAESEESDSSVAEESSDADEVYLFVTVDLEGRILNRKWNRGDATLLSISFEYESDNVILNWEIMAGEKTEEGQASYQAKPFEPTATTFAPTLDKSVVIDMPLMKPSFYRKKLNELKGIAETDDADAIEKAKAKPVPLESGPAAINLIRHELLSQLQELSANPQWGPGQQATDLIAELLALQKKIGEVPNEGDVTLIGSTGNQPFNYPEISEHCQANGTLEGSSLVHYFNNRADWKRQDDDRGLVAHLSHFNAISQHAPAVDSVESFTKNFADSPLMLAAFGSYQSPLNMDQLLKLNDDPRWSGVALIIATTRCSDDNDKKKVATAFWKWHDELAREELHPILFDQVVQIIKSVDEKRTSTYLGKRLEAIKKLDSTSALLSFAEQLSVWGESKLADSAYSTAREKLGLDDKSSEPTLLKRFAFGNALWAGNRYKESLEQFDLILADLESKQIPLSPAFCAAMARLVAQTGDNSRAVELEERALELEQPYLPSAINLQAFRQRYQWLWSQYELAIGRISADDSERESKIDAVLVRAKVAWDRWMEVDRDNVQLPRQMASLLKSAGREEESWEYLSSVIDQKPNDASSYTLVGQWYRDHGDLAKCVRWFGEAPQWDTANPQWIFNYASALKEIGRKSEANVQFNKIINGKWAPGLQQWIERAQNEL